MRFAGRNSFGAMLIGAVASPIGADTSSGAAVMQSTATALAPTIAQLSLPLTRAADKGFTQGQSGVTTEAQPLFQGQNTTLMLGAAALGLAAFWLLSQKS